METNYKWFGDAAHISVYIKTLREVGEVWFKAFTEIWLAFDLAIT